MATLSTILGFVQTGSADVSGYTVYPSGASGVNDAFVKLETNGIIRYYAFSLAVLRKIALADESIVPSSDDTNIERYDEALAFKQRYSRDAKGVLQYEDAANVLHYLFYPDPSVTDTTIQTFTTDTTRYSSSTSFNLTVVNPDDSQDTFQKTANTNIIQPVGTGETIFVVYDDIGFLQAATEKIVGIDGVTRDVVPGDGIVKYIKPDGSIEYYKKGALYDGSGAVTGSLPFFKQVNRNGPGDYSDFTTPITWREYGTPDPISKYQFANNSAYLAESTLVSGGYVNPSSNNSSVETVRTFYKVKTDLLSEQGNKYYDFTTNKTALTLYEFTTNNITYLEGHELNYVSTTFEKISAYIKFITGGQGVSKKIRENYVLTSVPFIFYVFNETAKVQAIMQGGSKVPTGSIIHYTTALDADNLETTYSEFIKRYVAAVQYYNGPTEPRVPEWEVYTYTSNYSALGTVVATGTNLVNEDTIYVRSANPIAGQTPYPNALVYEVKNKSKRLLQLIERNNAMSSNFDYVGDLDVATTSTVSENAYLTFNTGVSESEYATDDAFAAGELRQRGSTELNAANDIIITKLTKNVVNTTEDQIYTHAYENRGLYWASKLASSASLRPSGAIKEVATTQATYNYIVQYVLQDANNDYYEYNGLATISLLNFTDLTGETLSGVSVSYPVMRTLYKRTVAENGNEGSPEAAYKKVIEQVTYLVDSTTPYQFYTYRQSATLAAINEDTTYIPIGAYIDQTESGTTRTFIKQSIGGGSGSNYGADYDVASYQALAALVTSNANFTNGKTVYFIPETNTYVKDAANVIVISGSPYFVAYDGAVTRKQYATSSHYGIGGQLRQRSSTQWVNVLETDVVYDKIGISNYPSPNTRNDSNLVKRSVNGIYEPVSFAYGDLGLLIAAQLHPANANTVGEVAVGSIVRKVTKDEYIEDGTTNYDDYVKYAENILKDGNTIYMEYFEFAALSIRNFVNSTFATYNVDDQLKQMNTSTGALINTFNKIAYGIALDTNASKYYEYNDLANAANTANSVIALESTIVDALLDDNVPVGRTSYTKKARALLYQIGTYGWDFFAYDQIGLRAAVLPDANGAVMLQNDNRVSIVLRNPDSTTTTYYHGGQDNLLLTDIGSNKQYITYRDVNETLSEETFAVANAASGNASRGTCTFSAGDQLLQRELSSNTELNPTVDNITVNKLAVKVVNISTEAGSTHVWEASGSQNGLLNAAQLADGSVASSIPGDFEIHTSIKVMTAGPTEYTRVQQYLLSLTGASPAEYFEFNAFATLSLQTFTQDNSTYPVETVLRKMNTTTGAQVQYYVKKIENVTKEDNLNNFFVFDNTGKVNAIIAAVEVVAISSTIVDDFNGVTWTKYYVDAAKTGSTWEAYSYPALASVAADAAFGTNSQVYLKERVDPYNTIHQYQYFASKVLQLNDGSLSNDFIAYDEIVSEQQFANGNQYGISASTLRQRASAATDASVDVVIYKLADKVVNNMSATSETRVWENEVSHPYQGLRNAANLSAGSDDTQNVRSTIIVKSSSPEVSYDYDALYLVKKTGTNEYYEFNARNTVSLNTFTTDDMKYPVVAKMHYMNTTNGDIQTVYNKVINQVSQEDSTTKFYVFNDTGKVAAIIDDTTIVPLLSTIYYNESASMTKRHVGAVQTASLTWEAYTLLALAAVSANTLFTSGHQVALNTQTDPITTTTTYDWYASKVLKEQNVSPNNFIAYDGVVSEEQFATINSYGQTATLNQRASSATTSADDIVITKLDYNLVNISNISAETHAYGDLGLRNAAIRTDGADLKSNTVREMGANAVYSFIVTYVLQDASNNYYEYNELQTITLENFTSKTGETLSGVALQYPVDRVLRQRNVTSGAKVSDYTKVMVEGVSKIDSPPNTFYTFSQAAREAAIDENNTIVPSIPPSTVYQTIAGTTTIFYKTAVSTGQRPTGPPDYEVGTYYALGQLAVNADISLNTVIYFTDIDTYYTKVEASVLQVYNSTPGTFIAYDGAVSRETFATGTYNVGAKLIQRSSAETSPDNAVPASDIVLDKIAANAVNRATGSLSSVYENVTYCYGELGLLGAATTSSAKATARLVTAADVASDAAAGVVNYSKIAAGLLKLGADKYYEYTDFAALSVRTFATGSSYIVADTLYQMNTTTGVEIKNYIKKMANVVIESVNSYYYVYDGGIVPPANAEESVVPIGAYIIVTAENNEPSVSDVANNAYYKRAISLVQIGTSSAFNAYSELGLRSAVVSILSTNQTVLYDSITWTSTASNIAVSGTTYLTYADANGTLSEETFAVSSTYDVGSELKQRSLSTPLSLTSTASDVSIQKLAVQVVNTSADSVATHAWEVAGSKNGLKNAAQLDNSTAVKAVIKDMTNNVSYDRLERYLLKEQTATPKYFEYNNQSTLALQTFTETSSYIVSSELHLMNTSTGVETEYYIKVIAKVSQKAGTFDYYVFSEDGKVAAIVDNGDIVLDDSAVHYEPSAELWFRRREGVAQSGDIPAKWEAYGYLALARASSDSNFASNHYVQFKNAASPYTLIATYDFFALKVLKLQGAADFITYDEAGAPVVSEQQFAVGVTYGNVAILRQRLVDATSDASDNLIYKLADKVVNNMSSPTETHVWEVAGGKDGLRNAAQLEQVNGGANADEVKGTIVVMTDSPTTSYIYKERYLLQQATTKKYFEFNARNTLPLYNFTEDIDTTQDLSINLIDFSEVVFEKYDVGSEVHYMDANGVETEYYTKVIFKVSKENSTGEFYVFSDTGKVNAIVDDGAIVENDGKINYIKAPTNPDEIWYRRGEGVAQSGDNTTQWEAYSIRALARASGDIRFATGHTVKLNSATSPYATITSYNQVALNVIQEVETYNYIAYDSVVSEAQFAKNLVRTYGDAAADPQVAELRQRVSSAEDITADVIITKLDKHLVNTSADTATTHAYGNLGLRNAARRLGGANINVSKNIIDKDNADAAYAFKVQYVLADASNNYYVYEDVLRIDSQNYVTLNNFTVLNSQSLSDGVASANLSYDLEDILYARSATDGSAVHNYTKIMSRISKVDSPVNTFYVYSEADRLRALAEDGTKIPFGPAPPERSTIRQILSGSDLLYGDETVFYKTAVGTSVDPQYPDIEPDYKVDSYYALGQLVTDASAFKFSVVDGVVVADTVELLLNGVPSGIFRKVADSVIEQVGVTPAVYIAYDGVVSRKRFATNDVAGYSNFPAGFTFAVESTLLQRSTAQTTPDVAAVDNQIELLKIAANAVNRKVGASWDNISYVYENLGMYGAARASASKSTVYKVTADDVALNAAAGLTSGSVDADAGVDEYSKPSANILLQGSGASAVYREYDQLDTLNIYNFSRTGSYSNGAILKEMSVVSGSEGAEVASYIKVDFGIMRDDKDPVDQTDTIYYVYGVIADAANSDYSYVAQGANIVDVIGVKVPTVEDLRERSYVKTSIGLLRKKTNPNTLSNQTLSSNFFAYSQVGLRTAVVSVLASGQDVTATTIAGYTSTVYTYVAANLAVVSGTVQYALGGGAEYLTYSDASGSLSKMAFANGSSYPAGAALVQRALSELTVAGTPSDVIIYKLVASVINTSDASTTYAYGAQGLANAAIYNGETAYSVQSTITSYPASDESNTTVYDYVARYLLKNGNDYYEYSGLSAYTLRIFSGATYDVGISVHQMNSSGIEVGLFTKSYADIMQNSANSHYYSYTAAALATIANAALATHALSTIVWEMASDNTPVSGDVQWTKVRLNVLEAAYSANKQYNVYVLASLGLVEFACSASFSNGDRLNDIAGSLVYDRIVRTVLKRTDETVYRTFYSDAFGQPQHLEMKTAAISSSVPVSSTVVRMDATSWTKAATGIMQSQADTGIYKTYQTASTYFLPAATFATSSSYTSGDLLETIADISANTVNYLKNLDYVIFNITSPLYQAYAPDGLKNAAQAAPLVGTRSSSDIYRADAAKIETDKSIQDMTGVETYFKPAAYPQNVLQKTATNNYYDYTADGNFGTFTLAAFANMIAVGATLTDMTGNGGAWKNEALQVISQTVSSVITYYTYSEGTASGFTNGNKWVQRFGTVASTTTVVEKFDPDNFTYTLLERGVFLRTSPGVYYAYNILSDAFGLLLNTFANDVSGYPFTTLVDRTSSRLDAVYERTAPGVLSTNGSNTAVDPSGVRNLAYSLAPGTTITESPAGNWPANTTRKIYEVVQAGLLKIVDGSNTTFYVYDTSLLTLHDFAVQGIYPIGNTYVDRSSTYDGPLYGKVLDGVLNQRSNEAAIISTEMLTFEDTGVMGLKNASLAEVGDISDGTILIPEVVAEPAYMRSAKGLLKQYNGRASSSGFSLNALAYQLTADDCSNSILAIAALNRGLVASTLIAAETNIYMQAYGATTYNKSVIGYVKDSAPFTNVLRVGAEAISDKISYAPADGTRLANLQNFCELDTSGSLVSENRDPKFGGKTITVMFNDCSAATVYSIARRGLMTNPAGDLHTFSSNGLVSAAAAGDFVTTFSFNFVSAGVETSESFKRVAKGLLLSNSQIGGAAGLNSTTSAILYYSDYSTFADDNLPNMYFYLYKLATQRSVGGATADTATYIRDPSGDWTVSTNTADQVIDSIAVGTITTLYSIVQRINVAATTEKYELVQDVSNALSVTNLTDSSKFYLAYGSQGLNTTYNGALDGIQALTLADTVIVPTGSIYYTADRYSVAYNNANKYTKLGKGLVSGPDGTAYVYSTDALRVFANQTLTTRSSVLPVGVPGTDTTNSSRTSIGGITYYWWERGVLAYQDAQNVQNFEVYPLPAQNLGAVSFVKRFAMARTNTTGVAADFADATYSSPAFVNGSKLVIYDASDSDVTGDTFYRKVDEGLVQNTVTSTYYAFSDYGLASAANATPAIPSAIAMGSSLDPNAVVSPVWSRQMTGLLRNGTAWTLYTNLTDISAGKQFFAQNSDLNNVMTYKTYSYPNTTTTMTTYTNVVDGSSNGVNTAILFNSPTLGENAYQTFGFAGLALMANSDISNIIVNKSTTVYAYPIVGDASNNVTAGLYRKLQTGAVYDSGLNILLMDRSQFQTVLDRFDIVEFASLAANVNSSIDVSATALNLSPMERFFLNGSSIAGTPFTQIINGTSYSVEQVLERDLLASGSYNWTTVLPSSATATDDVVSSLTVTNKNGSVMTFRYRRWLRPISIVG